MVKRHFTMGVSMKCSIFVKLNKNGNKTKNIDYYCSCYIMKNMAQDKVRYLGVLPVVNIELTERAESSSGNCSYGVSDYYIEKVEQQIERLKNEQNFLYDEKVPAQIRQWFFELKFMLEGYYLGKFAKCLRMCSSENINNHKERLLDFYTEHCGFSKITATKVIDSIKEGFLPNCTYNRLLRGWNINFDDILFGQKYSLFDIFSETKSKFTFNGYKVGYVRTMLIAYLLNDGNSSSSIAEFFRLAKLSRNFNVEAKDIESRKAKIKNKIGSYNSNFERDSSRILRTRVRLDNGHVVSQYIPTEIESELIISNDDMPTVIHKPIMELEFIDEKIGFRIRSVKK